MSTGSIQAAPTTRVERSSLGAPSSAQSQPMYGYGGDRSSSAEPRATGTIGAPRPQGNGSYGSSSSSASGTTVTLGRGENVATISRRYGVPANAILQANGLASANGVGEGRTLVIPTYSASSGGYRSASATLVAPTATPLRTVAPKPVVVATGPAMTGKPKMQFVQGAQPKTIEPGKTVESAKAIQSAKSIETVKPSSRMAATQPKQTEQAFAAQPMRPAAATNADDNVKTAALKPDPTPVATASAADSGPTFRWPARGRVISGYGSKTSGASNDGVNIAVPVGTEVKASDDGVVAYSGSDLKDFGNLVLIRHSNGWVTAYAHNSALSVKPGETVRRGQIIAKSGATGKVSSPQLHFEVRKGAGTVDPMKHLPDA